MMVGYVVWWGRGDVEEERKGARKGEKTYERVVERHFEC
jgi:hypothetical protein